MMKSCLQWRIVLSKDNIKKFRDQAKKLEDSDALKEARDKYVSSNEIFSSRFLFDCRKL